MTVHSAPTKIELVPYRDEHKEGVIALLQSVYAEYGQVIELDTLDQDLLEIPKLYAAPQHGFRVLLDAQGVVGTVAVKRRNEQEAELKRVFLHRRARGRGVGRALVEWAIHWARAQGVFTLHIWSDQLYDTAHHLYRRLGAENTQLLRYLGGRNQVFEYYFRLNLSPPHPRTP